MFRDLRLSICDAFTNRHLPANPSQQLSSKAAAEAVKKVQMELGLCAGGSPGNGARCLAAKSVHRMQQIGVLLHIIYIYILYTHQLGQLYIYMFYITCIYIIYVFIYIDMGVCCL